MNTEPHKMRFFYWSISSSFNTTIVITKISISITINCRRAFCLSSIRVIYTKKIAGLLTIVYLQTCLLLSDQQNYLFL